MTQMQITMTKFVLAIVYMSSVCISCRNNEERLDSEVSNCERKIVYIELPDYFRLEEYQDALVTDVPIQNYVKEITSASYEVQAEFPPDAISMTVHNRLTDLAWKELDNSLRIPSRGAGKRRGWEKVHGSVGSKSYTWDSWWVKDECAINVTIWLKSIVPGKKQKTRVTISHYQGPQTVELIKQYEEQKKSIEKGHNEPDVESTTDSK